MKTNPKVLILTSLLAASAYGNPKDWHLGAEMSYAQISGTRAYEASNNFNATRTKDMLVPSLKLSAKIGDNGEASIRYTVFDDIDSYGVSSDTDIFDKSEFAGQAITEYVMSEEIEDITFTYLYEINRIRDVRLSVGPNFSFLESKADFYYERLEGEIGSDVFETVYRYIRSFSSSDVVIGAEANAAIQLSDRARFDLAYRFLNPPDRDIHMLSLSLNYGY